jgi:hypothetical protein
MAKIGRPRIENPKKNMITFRMRDDDRRALNRYASMHNITISEALEKAVRNLIEATESKSALS